MKKIICIFILGISLLYTPTAVFASSDVLDTSAPSCEETVYTILDTIVSVQLTEAAGPQYTLEFSIANKGAVTLENWSIAYESDYDILNADCMQVLDNSSVKTLAPQHDEAIAPGDRFTFSITVYASAVPDTDCDYRIYGTLNQEDLTTCSDDYIDALFATADFTSYDIRTGEEAILTFDPEDIVFNEDSGMTAESAGTALYNPDSESDNLFKTELINTISVLGNTDTRTRVTSVTSNPYYRIACLHIKYEDSSDTYCGTGFMISEDYLLTAAHVVYNVSKNLGKATSIKAYFGANGSTNKISTKVTSYAYSSSWPSTASTKNDWAWCKLAASAGSTTGWFSIGYTTNAALKEMTFTVCGYPQDKYKTNSSSENGGYNVYMYKDSSAVEVKKYQLRYTLDTYGGQSGAPVYNGSNIVYGIHHGNFNQTYNTSCRITKSIFNALINAGVCSN